MSATLLCLDERTTLRDTLRATRECFLHLSLRPQCAKAIANAVMAVERLGEHAMWHDQAHITRLADRMASILRGAALSRFGMASADLGIVHRLLGEAISYDTTPVRGSP